MQIGHLGCLSGGLVDIKIVSISKMSQIDQKGGVSIFQKCLKFKNVSIVGGGGGATLNETLSHFFPFFFSDANFYDLEIVLTMSFSVFGILVPILWVGMGTFCCKFRSQGWVYVWVL